MLLSRINMSYIRRDIFDYCDSEFLQYITEISFAFVILNLYFAILYCPVFL